MDALRGKRFGVPAFILHGAGIPFQGVDASVADDVAVKLGKPWVYGGCIGSHGQTMTILPGETPCLRCVFEAAPAPGEAGTCETAGVLSPIVNIVASFQAAEAFKILTGHLEQTNRDLIYIDVWDNAYRPFKIAPLRDQADCPCCKHGRFEWLDGTVTRMEELAYQRLEGERIAEETFFYDPAQLVPKRAKE